MKKALLSIAIASAFGVAANAANTITATNVEGAPGSTVNVQLVLTNDAAVAGFQANIAADKAGLTLGAATLGTRTIAGTPWIGSNAVSSTSYNVLMYSPECNTYTGAATQTVAVIPVTIPSSATAGTTYTLTIQNGIVSNASGVTANCTSSTVTVKVKAALVGDVNGNGKIDINDVQAIYDAYNTNSTDLKYDINGNGKVDINDVQAIYDLYNS